MTKLKNLIIGDAMHPLPVAYRQNGDLKMSLFNINQTEISFPTSRDIDDDYVYGELMRNLPTRSMLPYFRDVLINNDPNRTPAQSKSYVQCFLGAPSVGKSFMFKQMGKLTHQDGCLFKNCTDIDAGSLFYETVFDSSSAQKEKDAIDAKILQGNIDPQKGLSENSRRILKDVLGPEVYSEENRNGKLIVAIDWNAIKSKTQDPEREVRVLNQMIKQVCNDEGIVFDSSAAGVGITTIDGPIIRALKDPNHPDYGRPVLVDEWNRCKPGTDEKLLEFISFLSDEKVSEITLPGGGGKEYTFKRSDLPDGFMLYATGNKNREGMGFAHSLSKPQISRLGHELDVKTVPDPTVTDFTDRIMQCMTGVPVGQIFAADSKCETDGKYFVRVLEYIRKVGLTKEQIERIPMKEMLNIQHVDRVIDVAQSLATVLHAMYRVINDITSEDSTFNEKYKSYLKEEAVIDFRYISKFLSKAEVVRPKPKHAVAGGFDAILNAKNNKSSPERNAEKLDPTYQALMERGTNLEAYLADAIYNIFLPVDLESMALTPKELSEVKEVYNQILDVAKKENFGFASREQSSQTVGAKYNLKDIELPMLKYRKIKNIISASIRRTYPELPAFDTSLISDKQIELMARKVSEHQETVVLLNNNLDQLPDELIQSAGLKEYSPFTSNSEEDENPELVDLQQFLESFQIKEMYERNINVMWSAASQRELNNLKGSSQISDRVFNIMSGKNQTPIRTTILELNDGGENVPVCALFRNISPQQTMFIVNAEVDSGLKDGLEECGVYVVDKNTDIATGKKYFETLCKNVKIETRDIADSLISRSCIGMDSDSMPHHHPWENIAEIMFQDEIAQDPEICTKIIKNPLAMLKQGASR